MKEKPSKEDKSTVPEGKRKHFKEERGLHCENTVENSHEMRILNLSLNLPHGGHFFFPVLQSFI